MQMQPPGTPYPAGPSGPVGHPTPQGLMSNDGLWRWDGRQWVPAAPVHTPRTVRPVRTRSRLAVVSLALVGLAQLALMGALVGRLDIVNRFTSGAAVTFDDANNSDHVVSTTVYLWLGALVLCAVIFLVWLHRVVANNHALGALALRFSPGGAVGWWFCPIINWVRPVQIMSEAWRASDPQTPASTPAQRAAQRTPLVLVGWYLFFVVGNLVDVVGNIISRSNPAVDAQALDTLRAQTIAYLFGTALWTVAAVFAIVLVLRITDRQEQLQAVVASASAAPVPVPA